MLRKNVRGSCEERAMEEAEGRTALSRQMNTARKICRCNLKEHEGDNRGMKPLTQPFSEKTSTDYKCRSMSWSLGGLDG